MIKLADRINAFAAVGNILNNLGTTELQHIHQRAYIQNNWFTSENIDFALRGLQNYLDHDKLEQWTKDLPLQNSSPKEIGVIMAGNIPIVGFHDFLTILISGHILRAKLSSQDTFLINYIAGLLTEIEPRFSDFIRFEERLIGIDAMIATGSNNSSRYFEYYFSKIPNIIRKNRTSIAILNGKEDTNAMIKLGIDIFQYFGLGCRNVSKVFIPENYDFKCFFESIENFTDVIHHHKYKNNYDYYKSIYLINKESHLDNGFLLLRESQQIVSPISVLFYETYRSQKDLTDKIEENIENIQCIVSDNAWFTKSIPFGQAQHPELWDYADNVDTLTFVKSLK